mmetsp:Transcript_90185/g.250562  ORF Transcript_90185/g.250562 Transcript_90185/m.250562 type:complete len:216 (-) Transcript_90185:1272-1919(-)
MIGPLAPLPPGAFAGTGTTFGGGRNAPFVPGSGGLGGGGVPPGPCASTVSPGHSSSSACQASLHSSAAFVGGMGSGFALGRIIFRPVPPAALSGSFLLGPPCFAVVAGWPWVSSWFSSCCQGWKDSQASSAASPSPSSATSPSASRLSSQESPADCGIASSAPSSQAWSVSMVSSACRDREGIGLLLLASLPFSLPFSLPLTLSLPRSLPLPLSC